MNEVHKSLFHSEISVNFIFIFAIGWGLAGHFTDDAKRKLDSWLSRQLESLYSFGQDGGVFDHCISPDGKVSTWKKSAEQPNFDPNTWKPLIATSDTLRYSSIMKTLIDSGHNVMLMGSHGTGKSSITDSVLLSQEYARVLVRFNARMSTRKFTEIIEKNFEIKRKNVLGPSGSKLGVIYAKDLQMGDSCSSEFLRSLLETKSYYSPQKRTTATIRDFGIVATVDTQTKDVEFSDRLLHQFFILRLPEPNDESLQSIFQPILKSIFIPYSSPDLLRMVGPIVESTVGIYRDLCKHFVPSRAHPHYQFTLDNVVRVFKGLSTHKKLDEKTATPNHFIKLWKHEISREFSDLLVSEADRNWLKKQIAETVARTLKAMEHTELDGGSLFANFQNGGYALYTREQIKGFITTLQEQSKTFQSLIISNSLIDQVAKLSRLLRQSSSHVILFGKNGSGRRTVLKLVSELCGFQLQRPVTYSISHFETELKKHVITAGASDKETVFLLTEQDIFDEVIRIMQSLQIRNTWR